MKREMEISGYGQSEREMEMRLWRERWRGGYEEREGWGDEGMERETWRDEDMERER